MTLLLRIACILILCFFIHQSNIHGQDLDHLWSVVAGDGNGGDDYPVSTATDQNGNLYTTGIFEGFIDFDQGSHEALLSAAYYQNNYLIKYDSTGRLLWARAFESPEHSRVIDLRVDSRQNVFVVGYFVEKLDFTTEDDTLVLINTSARNTTGFIAKYSKSGQILWAKKLDGTGNNAITCIDVDSKNNIVIGGYFSDSLTLDSQITASRFTEDIFLAKLDSTGHYRWAFNLYMRNDNRAEKIHLDAQDNIVVTGYFESPVSDFDPGPNTVKLSQTGNVFLAKYGPSGDYIWAQTVGGKHVEDLVISGTNEIYICGTFISTRNFNTTGVSKNLTAVRLDDAFLAKYSPTGSNRWAFGLGSANDETATGLSLDNKENIVLTGTFSHKLDFDPSTNTATIAPTGNNFFIASYDSSGSYKWAYHNPSKTASVSTVLHDRYDHFWIGGYFKYPLSLSLGGNTKRLESPQSQNSFFARFDLNTRFCDTAWTVEDRNGGADIILDIASDTKGNVVGVGSFEGKMNLTNHQKYTLKTDGYGGFVVKYDRNGKNLWGFELSDNRYTKANAVACDSNNNIYVTGYFRDTLDLDPSDKQSYIFGMGSRNLFIAKYNPQGKLLWGYGFKNSQGIGLSVDGSQNILITGSFWGNVDFDPGPSKEELNAHSTDNPFILKFDRTGGFKFVKQLESPGGAFGHQLENGTHNSLYIAGTFRYQCDFDPGTNQSTLKGSQSQDPFLAKYDSLGNYKWAKVLIGSSTLEYVTGLTLDNQNNIYLSGAFGDTLKFNQSNYLFSEGGNDAFIASYQPSGKLRWKQAYGSNGRFANVATDVSIFEKSVCIAGSFRDTVDFDFSVKSDSVLISKSVSDIFMLLLDTHGRFIKVTQLPSRFSAGNAKLSAYGKKLFLGGYLQMDLDFDPDPENEVLKKTSGANGGASDMFIAQYGKYCKPSYSRVVINQCGPYLSPSKRKYFHQNGTYRDTVLNHAGCDSIITLHVTLLNQIPELNITACDLYVAPSGRPLTESGSYFDTVSSTASCDSVVKINLLISGSTEQIRIVSCDSILSPNGKTYYTRSGAYVDSFKNIKGCDSLIVTSFTQKRPSYSFINAKACDGYVTPSGLDTFTQSGVYYDTLVNQSGCDSIISINLELLEPNINRVDVSACNSYLLPNGKTISKSGTYQITFPNYFGCDSVVNYHVKMKKVQASIVNDSNSLALLARPNTPTMRFQWYTCDSNGLILMSGRTDSILIPTLYGQYAVEVEDSFCIDTSDCFDYQPAGITQGRSKAIEAYPNPFVDQLHIEGIQSDAHILITTISGEIIYRGNMSSTRHIALDSLASGCYYLLITTANSHYRKKIIKL